MARAEPVSAADVPKARAQRQMPSPLKHRRESHVHSGAHAVAMTAAHCTACGNQPPVDSLFCDQCGLPMKKRRRVRDPAAGYGDFTSVMAGAADDDRDALPSPFPPPTVASSGAGAAFAPLNWTTQRWVAPGAALASLLVLVLGGVIWQAAAPLPTPEEVMESLQRGDSKVAAPSSDLLCLRNLPYHRHHIQIRSNDQVARDWLDSLVTAGLYAPPVEVVPEGMTSETATVTLLQYQTLPAINPWRRNGQLCVAERWVLDSMVPGSLRKEGTFQSPRYTASLVWRAENVAPWFLPLQELAGARLIGISSSGTEGLVTHTQQRIERIRPGVQ